MKIFAFLLSALSVANAFSPAARVTSSSRLMAADSDRISGEVAGFSGVASLVAASMLFFSVQQASAAAIVPDQTEFLSATSSSIQVAEVIKTLDMSLPSYGEVKDPTASADTAGSLTVGGKNDAKVKPKPSIMSEEAREAKKAEAALSPKQKREMAAAQAK